MAALGGADLVVEAIYEDLEAKRDVFARLDGACKPTAVLASNTSTLSIDAIADAVADPARVVGTCVEINQWVGCTSTILHVISRDDAATWLGRAVWNGTIGHRAGVASTGGEDECARTRRNAIDATIHTGRHACPRTS